MVTECPHCYLNVVPYETGACPNCGKDVNDANPRLTRLTIPHKASLPEICCACGGMSDRFVKIERSRTVETQVEKGEDDGVSALLSVFSLIFGILGFFVSFLLSLGSAIGSRVTETLWVDLPMCNMCRGKDAVEPIHVDFGKASMTFVVDREFAKRVRAH